MAPSKGAKPKKAAAPAASAAQSRGGRNKQNSSKQQQQEEEEMDDLKKELELVDHGMSWNGQRRRQLTKQQSKQRTRTRRMLEKKDDWNEMEEDDAPTQQRIRGSRAAEDDRVIQGSLIFGTNRKSKSLGEETEDEDEGEERGNAGSQSDEVGDDDIEIVVDDDVDEEGDEEEAEESDENAEYEGADNVELVEADEAEQEEDDDDGDADTAKGRARSLKRSASSDRASSSGGGGGGKRQTKRRRLIRMRNFTSKKMAEQHGDALGAHAQGKPAIAIQKLKHVAKKAPSAPQIYSSLGMVYEDMLHETQRRQRQQQQLQQQSSSLKDDTSIGQDVAENDAADGSEKRVSFESDSATSPTTDATNEKVLQEELNLAKKAYGSYHAAAILCKRDYTLWLRAGDAAYEVAELHTSAMQIPNLPDDVIKFHRDEKRRWLEEAKHDYGVGDNLNPPSIDISAKFAHVMMELGLLAEALTLMTDLKDKPAFEESYRAWLLYSDLMLRVGHECNQWNRGVQTNSNYMFRRWLRKFCNSFDWQERRMQGLVKAMEAACGTQSCTALLIWLQKRVERAAKKQNSREENNTGDAAQDKTIGDPTETRESKTTESVQDPPVELRAGFEREKELLLCRNATELEAFDKTTRDMQIENDSSQANERQEARSNLIKRHKAALVTLVGEFHQRLQDETARPHSDANIPGRFPTMRELPPSASVRTVCSIASELMRHMIEMKLYHGGKLVGEAVSLYLKERAMLRDKRVQSKEEEGDRTLEGFSSILAMNEQSYDHRNDDGVSDDEDSVFPLSDDDDFDLGDEQRVLGPLRRGILPPEIRILYGVCLACEGGKAFFACQCLQIINELPHEASSWFTDKIVDTNVSTDSLWLQFRGSKTDPLGRTAAFAFAADSILMSGREQELAHRLVSIYQKYGTDMSTNGVLELVLKGDHRTHGIARHRQNLVLKILLSATRYSVESAESKVLLSDEKCETTLVDAINSLTRLLPLIWNVGQDGSISAACVEAIDCLDRMFQLILKRKDANIESAYTNVFKLVSVIIGSQLTISDNIQRSASELKTFPFPTSWLSADLSSLSLRAHNICVASNVSLFSGWENEQFTVRLLRGQKDNFFGVDMDGGVTAGHVSESVEDALTHQWDLVRQLVGTSLPFDFKTKLKTLRDTAWYNLSRQRYQNIRNKVKIVYYGEDRALSALMSFSCACLVNAISKKGNAGEGEREKLLFVALSILLPVSQFCLNEKIWNTEIGTNVAAAVPAASSKPWQEYKPKERVPAPSERPGYVRPSKRMALAFPEGIGEQEICEWFDWEDKDDAMSNLIALPLSTIGREWRQVRPEESGHTVTTASVDLMGRLDAEVKKLRSCHTAHAVETVSLHVASDLLQMTACPDCCNPVLCIQQAAMFAGQGLKGGSSDLLFHARLPKSEACTPLEALLTLGRADCLLSVYFYQEAAFLCNFVANVCSRHRDEVGRNQKDTRWRIVASLAYDLSVRIRSFSRTIIIERRIKEDSSGTWDLAAIDEFRNARDEGRRWKSMGANVNTNGYRFHGTYTAISPATQPSIIQPVREEDAALMPREQPLQQFDNTVASNYGGALPSIEVREEASLAPLEQALQNFEYTEAMEYTVAAPTMESLDLHDAAVQDDESDMPPQVYAV